MDTIRDRLTPLDQIPATRQLVEALFADGKITHEAREYALNLLYPARRWGLWVSRLLLALGVTLTLSGFLYFYAFNWAAIPDMVKLGSIEGALIACMGGALWRGLETRGGKFFALGAATLIGVFLAVFGQVYQTGADAWELFAAWALLILPFCAASCFAPVWGLWLAVANTGLYLFWNHYLPLHAHTDGLIYPLLGLFNTGVLAIREILDKRMPWLSPAWTRNLPAVIALCCAVVPLVCLVLGWKDATPAMGYGGVIGILILGGFYGFFRYVKTDVHALAGTLLAGCVVAESALFKMMDIRELGGAGMLLLLGVATITLFASVIVWLRNLSKELEVSPWMKH